MHACTFWKSEMTPPSPHKQTDRPANSQKHARTHVHATETTLTRNCKHMNTHTVHIALSSTFLTSPNTTCCKDKYLPLCNSLRLAAERWICLQHFQRHLCTTYERVDRPEGVRPSRHPKPVQLPDAQSGSRGPAVSPRLCWRKKIIKVIIKINS